MKRIKPIVLSCSILVMASVTAIFFVPGVSPSEARWSTLRKDREALLSAVYAEELYRLVSASEQNEDRLPSEFRLEGPTFSRAVRGGVANFQPSYKRLSDESFVIVDPGQNGVFESSQIDATTTETISYAVHGDDLVAWGELKRGGAGRLYITSPARISQTRKGRTARTQLDNMTRSH